MGTYASQSSSDLISKKGTRMTKAEALKLIGTFESMDILQWEDDEICNFQHFVKSYAFGIAD